MAKKTKPEETTPSTHPAVQRCTELHRKAVEAGDDKLAAEMLADRAKAEELAAMVDQATPLLEQASVAVRKTQAELAQVRQLINFVGTPDRELALERTAEERVLHQRLVFELAREKDMRNTHDSPAMALDQFGVHKPLVQARSLTAYLLELLVNPIRGYADEMTGAQKAAWSQGATMAIETIRWLKLAEHETLLELQERRKAATVYHGVHWVEDEPLLSVFEVRRRSLAARLNKSHAEAHTQGSAAGKLAEALA